MGPLRALTSRLRSEQSGITMIEVLVSALVLALLSLGVLGGLDGAQGLSNKSRLKSIAGNLAQADQERLRGLRAQELSQVNSDPNRTKLLRNVNFTIDSSAAFVSDTGQTPLCGTSRADYMKVTSTVTWPGMGGIAPVAISSLITPPTGAFGDKGALGVKIGDRDAAGVSGITVTLSGPQSATGTTDSNGCIFFGYLDPGDYTLAFSRSGYVDPAGDTNITRSVTIAAGDESKESFSYDRPGGVSATVDTKKGSAASLISIRPEKLSVANNQLPSGIRTFTPAATPALGPYPITGLFPFTDPYSVYSGDCRGANPALYPGATLAGYGYGTVTPTGTIAVKVREPAAKFQATVSGVTQVLDTTPNSNPSLATVSNIKLTADATGCGGTTTYATDAGGWLNTRTSGSTQVADPGVPVGTYDICAETQRNIGAGLQWYKLTLNNQLIDDPNGEVVTFTTYTTGRC